MLDRPLHHAATVVTSGEFYRRREAKTTGHARRAPSWTAHPAGPCLRTRRHLRRWSSPIPQSLTVGRPKTRTRTWAMTAQRTARNARLGHLTAGTRLVQIRAISRVPEIGLLAHGSMP